MSETRHDRGSVPGTPRRPAVVSLRPARAELPSLATLFAFMRDAELRFRTLRMRIEECTATAAGEQIATIDVAVRHPCIARVTTIRGGVTGTPRFETWLTDGDRVWTYTATSKVATERPARRPPRGIDTAALPGQSRVYEPLTALPRDTLPDLFVHPAGFCQNVLSTGRTWVATTTEVEGREGIVVECEHPRSVLIAADRPDHHLQVVADSETGIVLRLVETIGGTITRDARVISLELDAALPEGVFAVKPPPDARRIY